jgi:phosphate transport system ATP-binding protein
LRETTTPEQASRKDGAQVSAVSLGGLPYRPAHAAETAPVVLRLDKVGVSYGDRPAVQDVTMDIYKNRITALIGPSGCGKSSILRCLNRMNDLIYSAKVTGNVYLDGVDINSDAVDPVQVRRHVGMVFQKPNPFPMSIKENVAFGPKRQGTSGRGRLKETVEKALRSAALWDEVADKMDQPGTALSGGQQQRLCIARVLAVRPEIILMDEPCSSLDPVATLKIEDLMRELARDYTIVIVTHNMQQAARVSDYTAFMLASEHGLNGRLIEYGATNEIFTNPRDKRTEDYITGRFG